MECEKVTSSTLNRLILAVQGFPFDNTKTMITARLEATRSLQLNGPCPTIYRSMYSQTSFWTSLGRAHIFPTGSLHCCETAHPSSTSDLILVLPRLHFYSWRFRSEHSRSGRMGPWATWFSWRCPCSFQEGWITWDFQVPSHPNCSMVPWLLNVSFDT